MVAKCYENISEYFQFQRDENDPRKPYVMLLHTLKELILARTYFGEFGGLVEFFVSI